MINLLDWPYKAFLGLFFGAPINFNGLYRKTGFSTFLGPNFNGFYRGTFFHFFHFFTIF